MSYPAEENSSHVDFLDTPLPTALLNLNEKLQEAEAKLREREDRLRRVDEGVLAYEMWLSRLPAMRCACLTPFDAMSMLGAITAYASTGRKNALMEQILSEVGR